MTIYKEKFARILELYRHDHLAIHGKEYVSSWGEPVHGIKMYKSNADIDDNYVSVDFGDVTVNINGTVTVQQSVPEGKRTKVLSVVAFLDNAVEVLESSGTIKMDAERWLVGEGEEVVREICVDKPVTQIQEVHPADYGEHKAKAGILDILLAKKNVTIND